MKDCELFVLTCIIFLSGVIFLLGVHQGKFKTETKIKTKKIIIIDNSFYQCKMVYQLKEE